MVQRRGTLLEALFRISEGFFFGPHHLIMAALLYFEEKVHRKKLLRADAIPLLFPRLLCQILEHLGYPSEPQLERISICREIFTLDKWTSMTAYDAEPGAPTRPEHPEIPHPEHPEEPQPVEIPADMRAPAPTVPSTGPMPEVAPSAPPAALGTPPVILSTSEPPPPFESRIAISIFEFKGLCHTLQTLTATQSSLTQVYRSIIGPSSCRADYAPKESSTGEIEPSIPSIPTSTAEPSSPHDPPTTI
ncbi:hypothetical protein CK203_065128 [Vitis vinifera]|uniref:Uncharacterized protein n=1 Tax=Vitis vinifera TaxID=29760 RepID=A0A438GEH0_VITVI|nr:hypothetical protein CK203_065128 [Vitis vinifera]